MGFSYSPRLGLTPSSRFTFNFDHKFLIKTLSVAGERVYSLTTWKKINLL